jgi:spermidine/putrescine transport system substrate-binding protein
VVLTDWMAGRMINLGYVAPLDDAKFPNKANLVDSVKDVSFDPGRKYTVPWLSGMTGVGYNPKKTGRELTSINDIFDPKFKGQVTMLTEMRDTIGLVMLGLGKDPTKVTKADVEAACAKIKKARTSGQIRKFTGNDYAEDLAAGNIAIAFAWSGDIQGLAADNPDLRWIAPKEGAMLYSDNMMIPKTSDRKDEAMTWINYVYDPKHSAQIVAGAPYLSGAKGTGAELAKIAPDLAKSPLVNPPDELRARLHVFRALSDAEDTEFNRIFQDAIGA